MLVLDFGFGGGGRGMYTRQFSDGGSKVRASCLDSSGRISHSQFTGKALIAMHNLSDPVCLAECLKELQRVQCRSCR